MFLVCFAITSPTSFDNVISKWIPEVTHHCPDTPIILVGTKADMREDPGEIQKLRDKNQEMVTVQEVGGVRVHQCLRKCLIINYVHVYF